MGRYDSLHVTIVKNPDYLALLESTVGAQLDKTREVYEVRDAKDNRIMTNTME